METELWVPGFLLLGSFAVIFTVVFTVVVLLRDINRWLRQHPPAEPPPASMFDLARQAEAQRKAVLDAAQCSVMLDCAEFNGVAEQVRCGLHRGHAGAHQAVILTRSNELLAATWEVDG